MKCYLLKIKDNIKNISHLCHIIQTERVYPLIKGKKKKDRILCLDLKGYTRMLFKGLHFMPKGCNIYISYQQISSWSSQDKEFEWAVCYTPIKTKTKTNKCSRHHGGSVMFFTSRPTPDDLVFIQFLWIFLLVRCMPFWCVPGTSVLTVVVKVDSRQQTVLSLEETPHQRSD